jgi:hypothetical protein
MAAYSAVLLAVASSWSFATEYETIRYCGICTQLYLRGAMPHTHTPFKDSRLPPQPI